MWIGAMCFGGLSYKKLQGTAKCMCLAEIEREADETEKRRAEEFADNVLHTYDVMAQQAEAQTEKLKRFL